MTAFLQWYQLPSYPLQVWIVVALFVLLGLCVSLANRLHSVVRSGLGVFILCIVIGSSLALVRVAQTTHVTQSHSVEAFAIADPDVSPWQKPRVQIRGVIVAEPDRRPGKTRYTIDVHELTTEDDRTIRVHGRVLATDHAAWPQHSYGDEVVITGALERPGQIEAFHYDRFLSRYDIYSVIYRAHVKSTGVFAPSSRWDQWRQHFFARLFWLKQHFEAQTNRLYPEPHASFMAGLLTGSRRGIPEHLLIDFQTTGLTHIIAISGYNITIVIAIISGFLFFLPLRWRFVPAVVAIILFTVFVGASPAVVRAAIMGILGLLALQVGRQTFIPITILLTAVLMVAWNPKVLWYDVGFQLSFLSVLGLVYLAPFLDRICRIFPEFLGIRESFQMTLAAQLTAVPLTILLFGQFSLIAPLANIAVAPFIPLAMLFGFLGTVVSVVFQPLGLLVAYVGWGCLELVILLTKFFAGVPHALVSFSIDKSIWIWLYYILLCVSVWTVHRSTVRDSYALVNPFRIQPIRVFTIRQVVM